MKMTFKAPQAFNYRVIIITEQHKVTVPFHHMTLLAKPNNYLRTIENKNDKFSFGCKILS